MSKRSEALNAADLILTSDYATGMVSTSARLVAEELKRLCEINQELVEALKGVVRYAGNNGDDYLADQARAALKKLEESHEQ